MVKPGKLRGIPPAAWKVNPGERPDKGSDPAATTGAGQHRPGENQLRSAQPGSRYCRQIGGGSAPGPEGALEYRSPGPGPGQWPGRLRLPGPQGGRSTGVRPPGRGEGWEAGGLVPVPVAAETMAPPRPACYHGYGRFCLARLHRFYPAILEEKYYGAR